MTTAAERELLSAAYWADQQRKWFLEEHGGTLASYIERYGSVKDGLDDEGFPRYYGSGGEAIYAADLAAHNRAQERLGQAYFAVKRQRERAAQRAARLSG